MRANFDQTFKRIVKNDKRVRSALPTNIFSDQEGTKHKLKKMIELTTEEMLKDEAL